jgi:hypothetical protein
MKNIYTGISYFFFKYIRVNTTPEDVVKGGASSYILKLIPEKGGRANSFQEK